MSEQESSSNPSEKSIWPRVLYMVLFAIALSISETIIYLVAFVNLVYVFIYKEPHQGLLHFGKAMANYVQQIASYLTFNTEVHPFPLSPWPSEKRADT